MSKKCIFIILLLVFMTLSACGWQLRNNQLLSNQFGTVHISYPQSRLSVALELKRALKANNVKIVSATDKADYEIKIMATRKSKRTSALNHNARAAQYQISHAIDYMVVDAQGVKIIPPTTAFAEKNYNYNELDILASKSEEAQININIRQEIVRQILHRLGEASDIKRLHSEN